MELNPALVCHMYYEDRLTQQQIATTLGCSRIQVSRTLQQARAEGIVEIKIRYNNFHPETEARLHGAFPGVSFKVVDSFEGSTSALHKALAAATGTYLETFLPKNATVGVGWGSTLHAVANYLPYQVSAARFLPLVGGQSQLGIQYHASSVASTMAQRTGGSTETLLAPAVAATQEEKQSFVAARQVSDVIDEAAACSYAIFSVGAPFSASSTLRRVGYFSVDDIELLKREKAACDIISAVYFNSDGERCAENLANRMVGVSDSQLQSIGTKICVAGGRDKAEAIRIALTNGYVDTLITDIDVANELMRSAVRGGQRDFR